MIPLKEGLLNKKNIKNIEFGKNKFGITEKDLIGGLKGFPLGVVVRMLEEQELQGNKPDVTVFQGYNGSSIGANGFRWQETEEGWDFWDIVIFSRDFKEFYKRYPEYKKYDR